MNELTEEAIEWEHLGNYQRACELLRRSCSSDATKEDPWVWAHIARISAKMGNFEDFMKFSDLFCRSERTQPPNFAGGKIALYRRRIEYLMSVKSEASTVSKEIDELLKCEPRDFDLAFLKNLGLGDMTPSFPQFGPDEVIDIPHDLTRRADLPIALNGPHFIIDKVHDTLPPKPQFQISYDVDYISFGNECALVRGEKIFSQLDISARLWKQFEKYKDVVYRPIQLGGTAVILSDVFRVDNYTHWTLDWLPRLLWAKKHFDDIQWVCADIRRTAYQQDCQSLYWPDKGLHWLIDEGFRWYHFDKVICVSNHLVSQTHPAFRGAPDILEMIRMPALAASQNIRAGRKVSASGRRIYISRADSWARRGIINEAALLKMLSEFGFEAVVLSKMRFHEQAALFNEAEIVLASHGSGLTNVIFMKPGTSVIELLYYKYGTFAYAKAAIASGLKYYYMSCSADEQPYVNSGETPDHFNDFGQTSIWVDLPLLRKALLEIAPGNYAA